jgi:hypothetical protein
VKKNGGLFFAKNTAPSIPGHIVILVPLFAMSVALQSRPTIHIYAKSVQWFAQSVNPLLPELYIGNGGN